MDQPHITSAPSPIHLHLLHRPHLRIAGKGAIDLIAKDAALLAVAALEGGCPRARLAAWAWPDATPTQARTNLRQRLFRLHRLAGQPLVSAGDLVRLAPHVAHDLDAALHALSSDPQAGIGALLGVHDFPDAPGLDDWLHCAREQWTARCTTLLRQVCTEHLRRNRHLPAIAYAERLVRELPLHEEAHRMLMAAHAAHGDRSAALAAYQRLTQWLRKELGVTPSPETQAMQVHLLANASAPPRGITATPSPATRPVRIHHATPAW